MLPIEQASLQHPLLVGHALALMIGACFGWVLEGSGLGDPRRNAGQFYFRDLTAFKTIMTAILTTGLLVFLASSLGLLDVSMLYMSSTHLWPGILGGVVMGLGLLIGGYFIETAMVSSASLKLDGLAFLGGSVLGSMIFGESLAFFRTFWHASYFERLGLDQVLGWSTGRTLVWAAILICGAMLVIERYVPKAEATAPSRIPAWGWIGAGAALALASLTALLGQPGPEQVWSRMMARQQPLLDSRAAFVNSLEYAKANTNNKIKLIGLDLRPRTDFDAFHIGSSRNLAADQLRGGKLVDELTHLPRQAAVVLISDDEASAVAAWKLLKAQGIANLFILDGGIPAWRRTFSEVHAEHFNLAFPSAAVLSAFPEEAFTSKLKLQAPRIPADLYLQSN